MTQIQKQNEQQLIEAYMASNPVKDVNRQELALALGGLGIGILGVFVYHVVMMLV